MRSLIIISVMVFSGLGFAVFAQATETGFINRTLLYDGEDRLYQVYIPANYSEDKKWPVILFLHGAGEQGKDGLMQTTVGIANFIRDKVSRFPAIVVMPQSKKPYGWISTETPLALEALNNTLNEFSTDSDRVYITGLSNGGYGTWSITYEHTDLFAAALVICGYLSERDIARDIPPGTEPAPAVPTNGDDTYDVLASKLDKLPVWIFHGEEDSVVSVEGARSVYQALKKRNAPVRYTELPGIGHNSWDAAYGSDKVVKWLLSQRK